MFDSETEQENIFDVCVHNLILGCFEGYNATILAYGQTSSGKTYTMGTANSSQDDESEIGIVPRTIDFIFREIEAR